MKLTPVDIQNKVFKTKKFNGLDPDDVNNFLYDLSRVVETLIKENQQLKKDSENLNNEHKTVLNKEKDVGEALISANRIIDEMKQNSIKEAAIILSEAELKASQIIAKAENEANMILSRLESLKRQKIQFEENLKAVIETHLRILKNE